MDNTINSPSILLISSADPMVGPARVAMDYYNAFRQAKIDVDFLTLYPVEGRPDILYVYKNPSKLKYYYKRIIYWLTGMRREKSGYHFFYTYENIPQVPVKKVLSAIKKDYDLVLILFWQRMLSFASIKGIYDKLHCQIHFMGVDYSQMSGGCHFTCDCLHYEIGCGMCPGVCSKKKKDFTYHNVRYRECVYNKVKPVVYGNLYMRSKFYKNSYLLRNARIEPSYDIYDLNEYYPIDKEELRNKYDIPSNKTFIIFIGCQDLNDPRKGMNYLLRSMHVFWERIDTDERENVLLLIAGRSVTDIEKNIDFDYKYVGYVPASQMPELYSLSDVYLSPSIDDAGPTMVNQALCCATPVVAFEMGTALESIKGEGTGYCANFKDIEDFAQGIWYIYNLPDSDKIIMKEKCRQYAIEHFSYTSRVEFILGLYKKYQID